MRKVNLQPTQSDNTTTTQLQQRTPIHHFLLPWNLLIAIALSSAPASGDSPPPKPKRRWVIVHFVFTVDTSLRTHPCTLLISYTSYNIFFQLERHRFLQSHPKYRVENDIIPEDIDQDALTRPPQYHHVILPADWWKPNETKKRRWVWCRTDGIHSFSLLPSDYFISNNISAIFRQDHKCHGLISFVNLSKRIAQNWNDCDVETRVYCKDLADRALFQYREDLAAYSTKYGEDALKPKKGKEGSTTKTKTKTASPNKSAASTSTRPADTSIEAEGHPKKAQRTPDTRRDEFFANNQSIANADSFVPNNGNGILQLYGMISLDALFLQRRYELLHYAMPNEAIFRQNYFAPRLHPPASILQYSTNTLGRRPVENISVIDRMSHSINSNHFSTDAHNYRYQMPPPDLRDLNFPFGSCDQRSIGLNDRVNGLGHGAPVWHSLNGTTESFGPSLFGAGTGRGHANDSIDDARLVGGSNPLSMYSSNEASSLSTATSTTALQSQYDRLKFNALLDNARRALDKSRDDA